MHVLRAGLWAGVLVASLGCERTNRPVTTTTGKDTSTTASGEAAASQGTAMVRLVNALPGEQPLTVKADDAALFTAVGFKEVTPFQPVENAQATFQAFFSNATDMPSLADNRELLLPGEHYTIVVMASDDGNSARMRILRDELVPDSGKAQIRVINAAPGVGTLDVNLPGHGKQPLFDNVNFGNEAGFQELDPVATGSLAIVAEHFARRPLELTNVELPAGKSLTIVVTGSPQKKLEAITFQDGLSREVSLQVRQSHGLTRLMQ